MDPNNPHKPSGASQSNDETLTAVGASKAGPLRFEQTDLAGTTLAGYKLVRKLAEGGMGVVYEAIQLKLDRKVALKVLTAELSSLPEFLKRFEREAKAAAALNHPNLVQVHDFGEEHGRYYMIMEFVEGADLSAYVENHGKLSIPLALDVVEQAASALHAAYEKTIIHRDIKPSNLMLTQEGRVKVADLGLAKVLNQNAEMTATGIGIGSPYFIAPEQAADASTVDHRADIYSLGITLLFLLTGKKPFEGATPYSIVLAHVNKDLPSGAELGTALPPEVEQLIQRMSAKDPEDRYQDYTSLLADVRTVKAGAQPSAFPVRPKSSPTPVKWIYAAAAAVALLVVVIGIIFARSREEKQPAKKEMVIVPGTNSGERSQLAELDPVEAPRPGDREGMRPGPGYGEGEGPRGPRTRREEGFRREGGGPGGEGSLGAYLHVMGPPNTASRFPLEEGPMETMLAEAKTLEAQEPYNHILVINAYQQLALKSKGTPRGREFEEKLSVLRNRHQVAVDNEIAGRTAKMKEVFKAGDARAAHAVWEGFPMELRSWEVDERIVNVLKQNLPAETFANWQRE